MEYSIKSLYKKFKRQKIMKLCTVVWYNIPCNDMFQTNMSPAVSFSGMYLKTFRDHRNRANLK